MSDIVIDVEELGKLYRIGEKERRAKTAFDAIRNVVTAPFRNYRQITGLTKINSEQESAFWALKNISFTVKKGDALGIIGHNGAGKSTLLKILSRITDPTEGQVKITGRVSSLLEVGTGFHPELTGRENIYMNGTILGMTRREINSKFDEIVTFSGVEKFIDTPVKFYSSGMRVRLAFAVAAHLEPEILIIDEVLAVGDAEFQKKCLGKMNEVTGQGRTVLFVSHSMPIIKSLCSRAIFLKRGTTDYMGEVGVAIERYLKRESGNEIDENIPVGLSLYNSGDGRIKKIRMLNDVGVRTNELQYMEPFVIQMEFELERQVDHPIIDVRIFREGVELVHAANTYKNEIELLAAGDHSVEAVIKSHLQPGLYSIAIGIHRSDGFTIDYLEDVLEFNVLQFSNRTADQYPFKINIGMIRFDSTWKKIN